MSNLTPCNFCTLQRFKCVAEKEKSNVVMRPTAWPIKGIDVFIVPDGEVLPKNVEMIYPSRDFPNGNEAYSKFHRALFMGLSKLCAC